MWCFLYTSHFILYGIIGGSFVQNVEVNIGTFYGSTAVKKQARLLFGLLIPPAVRLPVTMDL